MLIHLWAINRLLHTDATGGPKGKLRDCLGSSSAFRGPTKCWVCLFAFLFWTKRKGASSKKTHVATWHHHCAKSASDSWEQAISMFGADTLPVLAQQCGRLLYVLIFCCCFIFGGGGAGGGSPKERHTRVKAHNDLRHPKCQKKAHEGASDD